MSARALRQSQNSGIPHQCAMQDVSHNAHRTVLCPPLRQTYSYAVLPSQRTVFGVYLTARQQSIIYNFQPTSKMAEEKGLEDTKAPREMIEEVLINPSGHRQELDRNFSLLSLCGLAISSGNDWIALGGSVAVAIYDGGPPGVLYEFIASNVVYWLIAASLAELASAMPSSGGVYHWASVTGGRYGRVCGWFAGW